MHRAMEVLVSEVRVAVYQGPCDTRCFSTEALHHPAWFLWLSRLFFSKQSQFCTIFGSCVCVNFFGRSIFNFARFYSKTFWSPQEILFSALSIQGLEPQHLSGLYFFGCCNITCKIPPRQSLCR